VNKEQWTDLAKKTGKTLVDTDKLIVDRAKMEIKDIFSTLGEEKFRELEREVISEISVGGSMIIATGGGAVLNEENIKNLKRNGRLFFIDRPIERLIPTASRPLSSDRESIEKRYCERYGIYSAVCDERIDADCEADAVADKILEKF
jgi:shikimate kinase